MADVLICFTQDDREVARACGAALADAGYDVQYDAPAAGGSRSRQRVRSEVEEARAVLVIWSQNSIRARQVHDEADIAAATGRLVISKVPGFEHDRLPTDLLGFDAGLATDTEGIKAALTGLDVWPRNGHAPQVDIGALAERAGLREAEAWAFVEHRGELKLYQQFLKHYAEGPYSERARQRLAELRNVESPEEDAGRQLRLISAIVLAIVTLATVGVVMLPQRSVKQVRIAAGGGDGAYLPLVRRYNDHLRQYGIELVPHPSSRGGLSNFDLLQRKDVEVALVKGGFAGALRDSELVTDPRLKSRYKGTMEDWAERLGEVVSLGRVALEPFWVFTHGDDERNELSAFDGQMINVGPQDSGSNTLATLLLKKNHVTYKPKLWIEEPLTLPKAGETRPPLGEARAAFLQQPAEAPVIKGLLQRLDPGQELDKARIIKTAAYSKRGGRILVVLADNSVRILRATDGYEIGALIGHTEGVNDAAFSPDGQTIATVSDDDTIRFWDAATQKEIRQLKSATGQDLNGVSFNHDGTRIVTASESDRAAVWELATGNVLHSLRGHTDDVLSANYSPDGKLIVTSSMDNTARIWNAESGQLLHVLTGHRKAVWSAVFSADSSMVVTASADKTAIVWNVANGQRRYTLEGHEDVVKSADFSPDGSLVITGSSDDTARIWSLESGFEMRRINGYKTDVNAVGFSPDGKQAMTASKDASVRLWKVGTWEKLNEFKPMKVGPQTTSHVAERKLHLIDFEKDADAYVSRFPFLGKVQLPRGAISFDPHIPTETVTLLTTTTAVVMDRSFVADNPALVRVLAETIVHNPLTATDESNRPRMFHRPGQLPSVNDPEFDVPDSVRQIYKTGDLPPVLSRVARWKKVPFDVAAAVEQNAGWLAVALLPVLGVLSSLASRALLGFVNWLRRRRLLHWYHRLQVLETRLDMEDRGFARSSRSAAEIERIDLAVSRIRVPLNLSDQYYDLRAHIDLVRQRIAARGVIRAAAQAASSGASGSVSSTAPSRP